ncbi:MAG: hypothetical protein A3D92_01090 [Bacteroidetes bacterium RIFCSPHIGHO2_02_FULL_44_7]|nr:MAG: hypothetical protein A3D92_01090 [Bacteroidetes bacterium RIFCSPHIGHO2_02_FULL_44_7]
MKQLVAFSLLTLALFSCQKVIDVDLNEANPQVVLEANYTAEDSTVRVRVSITSSYFDASTSPTVDNAIVTITDQAGNVITVPSVGNNGEYVLTNYIPQFNTTYTMNVLYNGVNYEAKCYLQQPVPLEEITYEFTPGFFGLESGYFVYLRIQDEPEILNNYLIVLGLNGTPFSDLSDMFLQDDLFTDGNLLERPLFGAFELFQLGDTVDMELRSVDVAVYDYYNQVIGIASGGGGAAPANPTSNWNNSALGYFNAYGNSRRSVIIQ